MTAWYNEPDSYAADWLENLIASGHIAPGVVDRRPIQEVEAFELAEFTQCHFFAGIGIWSGSCPCQPFSAAGKQKGFEDERHLWPFWFNLIAQCRPSAIVGEQVDKALAWIDLVSSDLEGKDYAFGSTILSAAGFGGAHIRHRNYFVGLADDDEPGLEGLLRMSERANQCAVGSNGMVKRLADSASELDNRSGNARSRRRDEYSNSSDASRLADSMSAGRSERRASTGNGQVTGSSPDDGSRAIHDPRQARSLDDGNVDWLLCRNPSGEPSWRPVEPGTFPLAHGVASRMGKLRAYGNALDFETATQFCEVVKEIVDGV